MRNSEKKSEEKLPQRDFFNDSFLYLSATFLSTAVSFVTLPVYTRYLTLY